MLVPARAVKPDLRVKLVNFGRKAPVAGFTNRLLKDLKQGHAADTVGLGRGIGQTYSASSGEMF